MNQRTKIFLIFSAASAVLALALLAIPGTREYQMHMFFASGRSFFADFFNTILSVSVFPGFNPYHHGVISTTEQIYPPFAYVSLLPFVACIPDSVRTLSGCYTSSAGISCCVIMSILMSVAVFYACLVCCRRMHLSGWVAIALFFSGLVVSALERGNLIVFAVAGIAVFLCHYDSQKSSERMLAVIGLSLAVSLKVTPVLFGVLWLNKRDFKYLFAAGLITVAISFLPLLASDHSIVENVGQLFANTVEHERQYAEWSVSINLSCVLNAGVRVLGLPFASFVPVAKLISFVLGAAGLYVCARKEVTHWERCFLLAAAQILIPSAPQSYVALFFIPALVAFLADPREFRLFDRFFFVLFLILTTPLQFLVLQGWSMNFAFVSASVLLGTAVLLARHVHSLFMRIRPCDCGKTRVVAA